MNIEAGATTDLSGPEIIAIINAVLGSTTWQQGGTGGSDTAAQILAKLLTVDGADSGLDADLLDGMTPAEIAALGGGSFDLHDDVETSIPSLSASDRFLISNEGVAGAPNQYVTLTRLQNALVSTAFLTVNRGLTTEDAVNTLIQAALAAAVTGNTETGIAVTHNPDGTFDFVVSGGGTPPVQAHLNYVGVRAADASVEAGDLTVSGMTAALALPAYSGAAHLIYAYPTAEGPPNGIYLYQDGHRNVQNQSSIFGVTGTVMIGGEEHTWRATDDAQTGFGGYILEQAR